MKKKKSKLIWMILILVILLVGMIYCYIRKKAETSQAVATSNNSTTTVKEVTVGTQTITKTLTSSGEISSNCTETLELNTYRYFKEIYVDTNDFIAEGEKILKYTNGTYLYAPYDLVVTEIAVPEEGYICTSKHGITVQSTESLTLTLSIDETEIGNVAIGQEVTITPSAYEDKTYTGKIMKINQIGNYASNGSSFTGTVVFDNDGDLKIGMSASCTIILEKAESVVAVPIEAIQTKNSEKYVIVENADGTTQNVTVETGLSNDAYVEIKSGLEGGETIQMLEETSSSSSSSKGNRQQGEKSFSRDMQSGGGAPSMPSGGQMPGRN